MNLSAKLFALSGPLLDQGQTFFQQEERRLKVPPALTTFACLCNDTVDLVLSDSLCTSTVSSKAGYWAPKSRQEDTFLQKVLAAKNFKLEHLPFRDAYLYQYGALPDQYVPPKDDYEICLHPCDKVDAKLPQSLLQIEAKKQLKKGQQLSISRVVSAWDGTMKNVTAPLLWRVREPLF